MAKPRGFFLSQPLGELERCPKAGPGDALELFISGAFPLPSCPAGAPHHPVGLNLRAGRLQLTVTQPVISGFSPWKPEPPSLHDCPWGSYSGEGSLARWV